MVKCFAKVRKSKPLAAGLSFASNDLNDILGVFYVDSSTKIANSRKTSTAGVVSLVAVTFFARIVFDMADTDVVGALGYLPCTV